MLDKLKNELAAAIAIVGGIMLGTGWALTWAKLASEHLPTDSIIPTLPVAYFVQAAARATLAPLFVFLTGGTAWIWINVWRIRTPRPAWHTTAWAAFGAAIAAISLANARLLNGGSPRNGWEYSTFSFLAFLSIVGLSGAGGWWVHDRRLKKLLPMPEADIPPSEQADVKHWKLVRAIGAVTLVICFLAGYGFRVLDAWQAHGALPVTTALIKTPCVQLNMYGLPTHDERQGQPEGLDPGTCELEGFYLGQNDHWVFMVKRSNPCPDAVPSPAFLFTVPREDVQQLAVYEDQGCVE